jgi:hypothetical protein
MGRAVKRQALLSRVCKVPRFSGDGLVAGSGPQGLKSQGGAGVLTSWLKYLRTGAIVLLFMTAWVPSAFPATNAVTGGIGGINSGTPRGSEEIPERDWSRMAFNSREGPVC